MHVGKVGRYLLVTEASGTDIGSIGDRSVATH
jgi:hypothetical protein